MGDIYNVSTLGDITTDGDITSSGTTYALAFDTNVAAAALSVGGNSILAQGTDAAIDINITPKGTGSVVMSKVDIGGGAIDGTVIGGVSPAAGTFTTLSVAGAFSVTSIQANSLILNDADVSNTLTVTWGENDTVNRNFTLYMGAGDRSLTLGGNVALNQNLRTTDAPTFSGMVLTGFNGFVVATGGTLSSTSFTLDSIPDGATYSKVLNTSLQSNEVIKLTDAAGDDLTVSLGGSDRILTVSGNTALDQNLRASDSPTFAGLILTGLDGYVKASGGTISAGDVTALSDAGGDDLTVVLGGSNRILTVFNSVALNQNLLTTSSPTFITITGATSVTSPSIIATTSLYCNSAIYTSNEQIPESLGLDVLLDGGFETWTDPNTLTNWTVFDAVGTNGTLDQESVIIHQGVYAVKLTNVGGEFKAIGQERILVAGSTYRIKFYGRGALGGEMASALVYDDLTTPTQMWDFATHAWVAYSFPPSTDDHTLTNAYAQYTVSDDITVPASNKLALILLGDGSTPGAVVYLDLASEQAVTASVDANLFDLQSTQDPAAYTASDYVYRVRNTGGAGKTWISITGDGMTTVDGITITTGMTINADVTQTTSAIDWDLIDNNASALSFDASGASGILEFVTSNGVEGVKFGARQLGKQGSDIVEAADITLGIGNYFDITGAYISTGVERILGTGWTAGSIIVLQFDASMNVRHGVIAGGGYYGFQLSGAVDLAVTAGQTLMLVFDGAWWRQIPW